MSTVLDTNAVLYILTGAIAGPLPQGAFFVSVVTEIEALSYSELDSGTEERIRRFFSRVTMVELSKEIRERAIALRRSYKLKVPDAIIAATAVEVDADLITNDRQLARVQELACRPLQLRER